MTDLSGSWCETEEAAERPAASETGKQTCPHLFIGWAQPDKEAPDKVTGVACPPCGTTNMQHIPTRSGGLDGLSPDSQVGALGSVCTGWAGDLQLRLAS